jgi:large subunit ribosomal protein L17
MRHQKKKVTLDRKSAPRRALLRHLAESLILHERIRTTKAKAKVTRSVVERLITKARPGTLAARRAVAKELYTENVVKKLVEVIAPRYKDRAGGYTRVVTLPERKGDGADEAIVEFV